MPIFRTAQTSNFTILSNAIANDESLSGQATAALIYLITKSPTWQFNAKDLKRRLKVGMNKVYRIMRELISAGYVTYQRIQSGCIWNIYDTKQGRETATSPAVIDRVSFERDQNKRVLERNESSVKEQQPISASAPILKDQEPVVVFPVDEIIKLTEYEAAHEEAEQVAIEPVIEAPALIYPPQIAPKEIPAAKAILAKAPLHLQQEVLTYLATMIIKGGVLNPMGYLTKLVASANNGTFAVTQAASATKPDNRANDKTQEILAEYRRTAAIKPDVGRGFMPGLWAALR